MIYPAILEAVEAHRDVAILRMQQFSYWRECTVYPYDAKLQEITPGNFPIAPSQLEMDTFVLS